MAAVGSTTLAKLISVTVRDDEDHDEQFVLREILLGMAGRIKENAAGLATGIESSAVRTLLVTGLTGTGKTYLPSCAANGFFSDMERVRNERGLDITDLDIARVLPASEITCLSGRKLLAFLKDLLRCRFLVIDALPDLRMYSRPTMLAFSDFLVLRHDSKKKTVLTTDLDPEVISAMLDARIRRRLGDRSESRLVLMAGTPYESGRTSRVIATQADLDYLSAHGGHYDVAAEDD